MPDIQEPKLTEYSCLTGFFNFDGSVVGDAFHRGGHKGFQEAKSLFYLKPIDNLSTMEWQHATADYAKILNKGIRGIIDDIEESLTNHNEPEQVEFLLALKNVRTTNNKIVLFIACAYLPDIDLAMPISSPRSSANPRRRPMQL